MLRQLWTIAANTFTEAIRQPIFGVVVLVGALGLVLNVSLAAYSMEPGEGDNKMLIDLGLSTVFLSGLILAAFSATSAVSDEIESKTALTVVSKPVPRPLFVLGKYAGVSGAILLAYTILSLVFLLTLRHRVLQNASDHLDGPVWLFGFGGAVVALVYAAGGNYLYRRPFVSNLMVALLVCLTLGYAGVLVFAHDWEPQHPLTEFARAGEKLIQICIGLVLIFQAVLMLAAVAVAVSTRFGQVVTLLISIGVFFAGIVSNSLSGWVNSRLSLPGDVGVFESIAAVAQSSDITLIQKTTYLGAKALYLVLPNLQFFWPADAISQGHSMIHDLAGRVTLVPLASVGVYGLLYTAALLALAVLLFQRREVS